jgi:hypothetical protein
LLKKTHAKERKQAPAHTKTPSSLFVRESVFTWIYTWNIENIFSTIRLKDTIFTHKVTSPIKNFWNRQKMHRVSRGEEGRNRNVSALLSSDGLFSAKYFKIKCPPGLPKRMPPEAQAGSCYSTS